MINKKIFISIFFLLTCFVSLLYADSIYNIEFNVKMYNQNDYDIFYYKNYKEIAKQAFRNNKLVKTTGEFPDGTINLVNFNNIPVAVVNMKNNKLDGICTFFQERYTQRTIVEQNYDKIISEYKDGMLNGITKVVDKYGDIIFELNYKNNILDGQSVYYDYNLMKKQVILFNNGIKSSESTYDLERE